MKRWPVVFQAAALVACQSGERRFPLRDVMWRDTDLAPVRVRCHEEPTDADPHHVSCAPRNYDATLYWDAADNMFFRPFSQMLGIVTTHESVNVNALDEVPDSSWFTNRIGVHAITPHELETYACRPDQMLDPEHAPDHSWLVDKGKDSGSTPGFRMKVPGHGKYLMKVNPGAVQERQIAATLIGEAVFWAAGYNASCEQALAVRPSVFKLKPGLRATHGNFGDEYDFDQKALDDMLAKATHRGDRVRMTASAWVSGYTIGQFRYEGTRDDDPNDVIPHQDRRELRGMRLLTAWIDHFDSREGNSLDTWMTDSKGGAPDSSPGHVVHYQIGTSAALGDTWDSDAITRRLGTSYILDWNDTAVDFITLGALTRPWDTEQFTPGHELFGYMNVAGFDPEKWKNEYPNAAFDRMTERDGAWMARILAHFTPDLVATLARMPDFTDPRNTTYLASVLEGRLEKILARYLTRLSPIADVTLSNGELCGVDLAEWRGVRAAPAFRYAARVVGGAPLAVRHEDGGKVCTTLRHVIGESALRDDAPERYVRVAIDDGVASGKLVVHLYDLGPARGFKLVGLERPTP